MNSKNSDNIQKRIEEIKSIRQKSHNVKNSNVVFNIAIELVAGGVIGIIIGWGIDNLFDSKPIFLIICIMLAFTAAFKTIWHKYVKNNGS